MVLITRTVSEETVISVEKTIFTPCLINVPRRRDALVIGYRRLYGQED